MNVDIDKIGKFIGFLRKEKKLTQSQLAEIIGVSNRSVSKWERGICLPEMNTIEKITNFFNISLMEFYAGEKNANLNNDTLLSVTKKAVKITEQVEQKKYQNIIIKIIMTFLIIILIFLGYYVYNTYNRYVAYNIVSEEQDYTGVGNIIFAREKSSVTLVGVRILQENIKEELGYAFEYELFYDNIFIIKSGDIFDLDNKNNELTKLEDYVESISIYLTQDMSDLFNKKDITKNKLTLKIRYLDNNSEIAEYDMNFNLEKYFANNKIIRFK